MDIDILNMEPHEEVQLSETQTLVRVIGGWILIYSKCNTSISTFIPMEYDEDWTLNEELEFFSSVPVFSIVA